MLSQPALPSVHHPGWALLGLPLPVAGSSQLPPNGHGPGAPRCLQTRSWGAWVASWSLHLRMFGNCLWLGARSSCTDRQVSQGHCCRSELLENSSPPTASRCWLRRGVPAPLSTGLARALMPFTGRWAHTVLTGQALRTGAQGGPGRTRPSLWGRGDSGT